MFFKRIFKYLEPLWTGNDGKISVRAVLAIAFSINFISNVAHAVYKWQVGTSLDSLGFILGIEASLIVALLGLTTIQNVSAFSVTAKKEAEISKKDDVQKIEGKVEIVD